MKTQFVLITGATVLLLVISAYAHHPFAAEYDWTKPVTLTGTVSKVEWTNPHAYLHVNAKDDKGQTKQWTLEMGSPSALTRGSLTPQVSVCQESRRCVRLPLRAYLSPVSPAITALRTPGTRDR